ncbi:MAG: NADPH-dependent 7-cyano-7-deazaguanine reductase QueF [Desulfobacterales bacterium]
MNYTNNEKRLPLGRKSLSPETYDPAQLRAIPRRTGRDQIGLKDNNSLPFFGEDIWNCWELSWLDSKGKPAIAVAEIRIPSTTPNIVESKSLKLYLSSFGMTRIDSPESMKKILAADIGNIVKGTPSVHLILPDDFNNLQIIKPVGTCIDNHCIKSVNFTLCPHLLEVDHDQVSETLFSRLIRTRCPVTGQPDWATVSVTYTGPRIRPDTLLHYFLGFRQHQGFHENCSEMMFCDILRVCKPDSLTLSARFTRRGGIDINPYRSTENIFGSNLRDPRQ